MRILISNDDGVNAPGIAALHQALVDYAECVVIAPGEDKSGASSALTLDRPLHPMALANGYISLNGTPTDCVHLGLNGLFEQTPDMVVSGINLGANLGDDVLYSGTVAAALEGRRAALRAALAGLERPTTPAGAALVQLGAGTQKTKVQDQPALEDEDTWALEQVFTAARRTTGPRFLALHEAGARRCALPSVCPLCSEGRQVTEWPR